MRKNFISSKTAIGFMAFTLLLTGMTGCYKDSRLDVTEPGTGPVVTPDAAYSISGTVTDAETGQSVDCKVTTSVGTPTGGSGAYNVALTKAQVGEGVNVDLTFAADGYTTTKRSVYVQRINDGSSIVYPVSVSLKKEYVTISGYVTDVNNKMVAARQISVKGSSVESIYNSSTFSFKLAKTSDVSAYTVEATVLDEASNKEVPASAKVTLEDGKTLYTAVVKFPFAIKDGEVDNSTEGGTTSVTVIEPTLDKDGKTTEEIRTEVADNTSEAKVTVSIPAGTKIENLGDERIMILGNSTTSNDDTDNNQGGEGETGGNAGVPAEPTDGTVVLKSFTGKPDGVKFTPAIEIIVEDEYDGQLGSEFALEYLNEETNTWAVDKDGGSVDFKDGQYIMNVAHFSTFRASLAADVKFTTDTISPTKTIDLEEPVANTDEKDKNYIINYKAAEGTIYTDYATLKADINSYFSNTKAQNLVRNTIKGLNPSAATNGTYTERDESHTTVIPASKQLNSYDLTTETEVKTYTVTINDKVITFKVEKIISVKISVSDKNMISLDHGHGHGDNDNAGGGIVTGD